MFRVLHVLDHSLPLHSGYALRTHAIMTAQAAAGLDVRGITGQRHAAAGLPVEVAEGLLFHRTGRAGPAALREWREIGALAEAIGKLVEHWRPDVLHAHSPAICGMAALRAARRYDLPMVYEIRAFSEDVAVGQGTCKEGSLRYRLTRNLENRAVAGADAVMTLCHGLRDDLIARGFPGGRIGIMPGGVALEQSGSLPPRDRQLADRLKLGGTDTGRAVIGYIGSFDDHEGLDVLIDAMPALLAEQPEVRLLLVGDGPMAEDLRERARASRAARAIRFAGRVPHAELGRYAALCDVMAFPRKASRLAELVTPIAPLEAMARGQLVAASAVGGHRELIDDGETGTLFAPDDPAECARALADLLHRRGDWPALREAARARVAARHDWSRNVRRYHDVYKALAGSSWTGQLPEAA